MEPRSAGLLRRGLVAQEIAVAFVLTAGAVLLLETYGALTRLDPGIRTEGRASFRLTLPRTLYPEGEDRLRFAETALERVRSLPGARHAAVSLRLPLDGQTWTGTFYPEGFVPAPGEPSPGADWNVVSADYFRALGIPLLAGRSFVDADRSEAPRVAIVDSWTADTFWPDGAVGKRLHVNDPDRGDPDWLLVVGVVGHVKYERLDEPGRIQVYVPLGQSGLRDMTFTVSAHRTNADPLALIDSIRRELSALAPDVPLYRVQSLDAHVASALALQRFNLAMLSGFAGTAFLLAGVGIFGLLSHSVARRRRELSVRMALGASAKSIVRLVMKEGLLLVLIGIGLGVLVTMGLTRFVASLLFGVAPNDVATLLISAAALAALALAASFVPARRAASLDPVTALREE